MKRIGLYLGFPPEGGGAFQYAQSVLDALANLPPSHYEIVVAHAHPAWPTKLEKYGSRLAHIELHEGGMEFLIRTALRFGLPLSLWRRAGRYLHPFTQRLLDEACDLWLFPAQEVWTYAVPTTNLGVIHDLMHRYEASFPEVSSFGLFRRRERHYRHICGYARAVLVDSEVGKRQVMESYGQSADRLHVLPFVAPAYMHSDGVPAGFEHRYRLPARFIFYPAQFWGHKNHIRLLQAMAAVRPVVPDLHLVLAGSKKNAYPRVLEEIERLDLVEQVHVLGYVSDEDMPVFYRRALALIMPTFFGPTNIPPLEAMAIGCPMAVSGIYAMSEQVGDAALLFDPRSVDEIAQAVLRLATEEDLRHRLAEAGRERAARWGQAHFNERLRGILDTVLGT
ncbi:MAG: glycosyltransferase family 4 protein [Betaproteobacteria bacterium]|nr:glycosyltransferase family 4 protein [Betaproteobacteria bacterium]